MKKILRDVNGDVLIDSNGKILYVDDYEDQPITSGLVAWFYVDSQTLELVSGNVAGWVNMAPSVIKEVDSLNDSTNTITDSDHTLSDGDLVYLSGALPTGFSTLTKYYVISSTATTFQLSATSGGSAVDFTGTDAGMKYHVNNAYQTTLANQPTYDGEKIQILGASQYHLDVSGIDHRSSSICFNYVSGTDRIILLQGELNATLYDVGNIVDGTTNSVFKFSTGGGSPATYNEYYRDGNIYNGNTLYVGTADFGTKNTIENITFLLSAQGAPIAIGYSITATSDSVVDIYEILIYDRPLLGSEAIYNNAYLNSKYGS